LENKYYLLIIVVGILLACSLGFMFANSNNNDDLVNNNDSNGITNISNSSKNTGNNSSNNISSDNSDSNTNNPSSNNVKTKTIKTPKDSKLSYSQAFTIAQKKSKGAVTPKGSDIEVYVKYTKYIYENGKLYWCFDVYNKKDGKFISSMAIDDLTGQPTMV